MQILQNAKKGIKGTIKKAINSTYSALPQTRKSQIYNLVINPAAQQKLIDNVLQLCMPTNNVQLKRELFKRNVRNIEIEVASFCNRTCWFCPNSQVDRKSSSIEFDESAFLRILDDLAQIQYENNLNFHRFNEPLANKELILKRIRQARDCLPKAFFTIFTNGDYLDAQYVKELQEAGLNRIWMSFYFGKNVDFDVDGVIKPAMQKMSRKLDLSAVECQNDEQEYAVEMKYKNLEIHYRAWNPKTYGHDRGGSIEGVGVQKGDIYSGCFQLANGVYVDYNGLVMPCCHTRSDLKEHESFILGDVTKSSIFDVYMGEKFCALRRELFLGAIENPICRGCNDRRFDVFLQDKLFEA